MPVIGELKALLADYQGELEKVPTIKEALEQFCMRWKKCLITHG